MAVETPNTLGYLIGKYKEKLRSTLAKNEDIIQIINPDTSNSKLSVQDILLGGTFENESGILYTLDGYILDYLYTPNTTIENKMFICVEVNVNAIDRNIVAEFPVSIGIFTNKNNVLLTEYTKPKSTEMSAKKYMGNRIDICVDAVERIFKGSEKYGLGKTIPSPRDYVKLSMPSNDYYGKMMTFIVKGYNVEDGGTCGS